MATSEPTLLLVDDNEAGLDMLARRLRKKGFRILTVTSGAEALLLLTAQPVDLVVLDLSMPEMDGIEVLQRLRRDQTYAALPVIMATAESDVREMESAFEHGADDYVLKPVDLEALVARIRALLRRRQVRGADPAQSSPMLMPVMLPRPSQTTEPPSTASPVLPRGYVGVGAVLGGCYRLDDIIGSGGFGAVYRAQHLERNVPVAVKVLHAHLVSSQPVLRRFQIEGLSAYRVKHKNAVAVLDSGTTDGGIPYLVMELLEGVTLDAELSRRGVLPFARCATIIAQVCDVLMKAHASGIIHRDIKPANIHLSAVRDENGGEVVKVLDFGLAKLLEGQGAYVSAGENLVGTPQFMAPERLVGKPADGRADVYSVGAMLYLMLTGTLPFRRNTEESLISQAIKQINTPPLSIKRLRPELPDEVAQIVMSAIAQSRRERPALPDIKDELLEWAERWEEPWPPLLGDIGAAPFELGDTLSVSVDGDPPPSGVLLDYERENEKEKGKERG